MHQLTGTQERDLMVLTLNCREAFDFDNLQNFRLHQWQRKHSIPKLSNDELQGSGMLDNSSAIHKQGFKFDLKIWMLYLDLDLDFWINVFWRDNHYPQQQRSRGHSCDELQGSAMLDNSSVIPIQSLLALLLPLLTCLAKTNHQHPVKVAFFRRHLSYPQKYEPN